MDPAIKTTRASQTNCSLTVAQRASLWCAHPRIKTGESISSWLHRSAFANGMADHTYCRHLFGDRAVWNRDVDHVVNREMLETAACATCERIERLASGTLEAFDGMLSRQPMRGGHFPWILSLGVYHRTRRRHGQQYCAACLRRNAWLPLNWRLAWTVCCTKHCCLLRDACPGCDAPFVFHRMSLAVPGRLDCPICGTNVLRGDDIAVPQSLRRFQQRMTRGLKRGRVAVDETTAVPTPDYLMGLRMLARGVFNRKQLIGLQDVLPRRTRVIAPARPSMNIEHWRLSDRAFALDVLRRLLIGWPHGFIAGCRRAGVYRARFDGREKGEVVPDWLQIGLEGIRRRSD